MIIKKQTTESRRNVGSFYIKKAACQTNSYKKTPSASITEGDISWS